MKAMILAGGFGKRLRPLTETIPKPLVQVGGKPILEWQISWLKKYGYDSFLITASYLADKVIDYLGDGSKWGVEVEVIIEKEPLGTGGALKNVEKHLKDEKEFVMVNGDNITNLEIGKIALGNNVASLALTPLQSPYGIVNMEGDKITSFLEKPLLKMHWINAGVYKMTPKIFKYLPQSGAIENTAFPQLAQEKLLGGVKFENCYWRGVDSIKDMEEVNKYMTDHKVYD